MLDDLVVEGRLAQDNWRVQVYVEVLEGDREQVSPMEFALNTQVARVDPR